MTVLLQDLLQDADGVLLENHASLTWHKAGSSGLVFASNTLVKSGAPSSFYRVVEDPGTRLLRVSAIVKVKESITESALGGVSACHDAVDGTAGYYFGIRSDGPVGSVRLFGWDALGSDLFPEESADYPIGLDDTEITIMLEVTATQVIGYVAGVAVISVTDASLAGTLVGLIGGWEASADNLYIKGPFTVQDLVDTPVAEECFPDTTTVVDDPADVTLSCLSDPATPTFTVPAPQYDIVLDDSCIPAGSLVDASWLVGDGSSVGEPDLVVG